jgi:hypothetical protein
VERREHELRDAGRLSNDQERRLRADAGWECPAAPDALDVPERVDLIGDLVRGLKSLPDGLDAIRRLLLAPLRTRTGRTQRR